MSILNTKIIMRSIDIGRNNGGKVTPILFGIRSVHCINQSFGVGISLVTWVGWSIVKHGFIDWVFGFVREDACGEHGNEFGNFVDAAVFHDVVVD